MGILSKLFGTREEEQVQTQETTEAPQVECPHTILMPRWDSVDDMGDEDKAIEFSCEACGMVFTPTEAREIRSGNASPS